MNRRIAEGQEDFLRADQMLHLYCYDHTWPRLRAPAFAVWATLLSMRLPGLPVVYASRREIAENAGIGAVHTVTRGLKELMAKGYLQRLSPRVADRRVVPLLLNSEPQPPADPARKATAGTGKDPAAASVAEDMQSLLREIIDQQVDLLNRQTRERSQGAGRPDGAPPADGGCAPSREPENPQMVAGPPPAGAPGAPSRGPERTLSGAGEAQG